VLYEKLWEHMTVSQKNFGMILHERAEMCVVRTQYEFDQPFGRFVIINRACVPCVEEPATRGFDHNTAMAARVSMQRDEIHLRFKRQTDGIEVVPFCIGLTVQDELRPMGNIAREVGVFIPMKNLMVGKGIVLPVMYVDFGIREIGQSAAVVEVHVGEDDMFYVIRFVSQLFYSIDRCFAWVKGQLSDDAEKLRHPGWVGVIVETEACIQKDQPLIRFDQQTNHACFQFTRPACVAGEAVKEMNGHGRSVA
jgi:hypothetical protein